MIGDSRFIHKKGMWAGMCKQDLVEALILLERNNYVLNEYCETLADVNGKLGKLLEKNNIAYLEKHRDGTYWIIEVKEENDKR